MEPSNENSDLRREKRKIVIGDVHGCLAELLDLLKALDVQPQDELISVGDLICKGPDSLGVLNWARNTPNLKCILGNHELRFLEHWRRGKVSKQKSYDQETYDQLGSSYEECMRFLDSLPFFLHDNELLVVHAGIRPHKNSPEAQDPQDLVSLRILPDGKTHWYEAYADDKLIVFGHWARPDPLVRKNAIGLDTGCVYGGALSALVLPERRIISVPARRVYRKKESWPVRKLT